MVHLPDMALHLPDMTNIQHSRGQQDSWDIVCEMWHGHGCCSARQAANLYESSRACEAAEVACEEVRAVLCHGWECPLLDLHNM